MFGFFVLFCFVFDVGQTDSLIHIHIGQLLFTFFPVQVTRDCLSSIPCALQEVLLDDLAHYCIVYV